ncbi:hypothetical protein [Arthrobacter caoxuetaonis]|uniref:Uncharacterized protein n=1 Tax=Arthrobacter caoxuetaonis TaxID=2886935 RepID=A0A9X1SDL1_9MICC|nr:hypothetical protein [Arthrobacter caoxuetaonis]MCC3299308.1 hypothetical protein [Arthrobacter caoxuetaonis]USQ59199.1 hypothetical protein NF551_16580 [Arthrobacter caoxuetaonis]
MSTILMDQAAEHSPVVDELDRLVSFLECIEKKTSRELRSARLASAALRIQYTAPSIREIVISGAGTEHTEIISALSDAGQNVPVQDLEAAAGIIAALPKKDFIHPAGTRVVIAEASAWWPGQ